METLLKETLEEYTMATGLPIHIFSEQEICCSIPSDLQLYNLPLYLFTSLPNHLPDAWITSTDEKIYLGGFRIKDGNKILLLGPVFLTDCTVKQAKDILLRLGQNKRDPMEFRHQLNLITHTDVPHLRHHISLLYLLLNREPAKEVSYISFLWMELIHTSLPIILTESKPDQIKAGAYVEDHILDCVRHGKTNELIRLFNDMLLEDPLEHPKQDDLDLRKSYIFGANTMLSRTARGEGVDLATVNTLSDYYIEHILQTTTISELNYLFYQFSTHYTEEIRKLKTLHTDSLLANKVGAYIQSHIYEKLSTKTIADALGFSDSYLCSEFKKATGTTITKYLTQCKINEAKYLLERSDSTITELADILQFSSVTYFCNIFKKYAGATPVEWKNRPDAVI